MREFRREFLRGFFFTQGGGFRRGVNFGVNFGVDFAVDFVVDFVVKGAAGVREKTRGFFSPSDCFGKHIKHVVNTT